MLGPPPHGGTPQRACVGATGGASEAGTASGARLPVLGSLAALAAESRLGDHGRPLAPALAVRSGDAVGDIRSCEPRCCPTKPCRFSRPCGRNVVELFAAAPGSPPSSASQMSLGAPAARPVPPESHGVVYSGRRVHCTSRPMGGPSSLPHTMGEEHLKRLLGRQALPPESRRRHRVSRRP